MSAEPVREAERPVGEAKAKRPRGASARAVAAGSRIDAGGKAEFGVPRENFFSRAGAAVEEPFFAKTVERLFIGVVAGALPHHRFVGGESEAGKNAQDVFGRARNVARRIHVFDAHEPDAVVGAGVEPASHCRHQASPVQASRRGGGESSSIAAHDVERRKIGIRMKGFQEL